MEPEPKDVRFEEIEKDVYKIKSFSADKWYIVDLQNMQCSCPASKFRGGICKHIKYLQEKIGGTESDEDVLVKFAKEHQYEIISSMHKEIRRADVERALFWAQLFQLVRGKKGIRNYIRGMVFEETRSQELAKFVEENGEENCYEIVKRICATRKKWEFEKRWEIDKVVFMALRDKDNKPVEMKQIEQIFNKEIPMCDAFQILEKEMNKLQESYYQQKLWEVEGLNEASKVNIFNTDWTDALVEFIYCGFPKDSDMFKEKFMKVELPVIPDDLSKIKFPVYAFDMHTREGIGLLEKNRARVIDYDPPSSLDLRWSGGAVGIIWRDLAYDSFGKQYKEKQWKDVPRPEAWILACHLDFDKWFDSKKDIGDAEDVKIEEKEEGLTVFIELTQEEIAKIDEKIDKYNKEWSLKPDKYTRLFRLSFERFAKSKLHPIPKKKESERFKVMERRLNYLADNDQMDEFVKALKEWERMVFDYNMKVLT